MDLGIYNFILDWYRDWFDYKWLCKISLTNTVLDIHYLWTWISRYAIEIPPLPYFNYILVLNVAGWGEVASVAVKGENSGWVRTVGAEVVLHRMIYGAGAVVQAPPGQRPWIFSTWLIRSRDSNRTWTKRFFQRDLAFLRADAHLQTSYSWDILLALLSFQSCELRPNFRLRDQSQIDCQANIVC